MRLRSQEWRHSPHPKDLPMAYGLASFHTYFALSKTTKARRLQGRAKQTRTEATQRMSCLHERCEFTRFLKTRPMPVTRTTASFCISGCASARRLSARAGHSNHLPPVQCPAHRVRPAKASHSYPVP